MERQHISIDRNAPGSARPTSPTGGFVRRDDQLQYRIAAHHRGAPFLMSLASDTDLWMFVTSGGGLTAGRVDAEGALFPYQTVNRLHEAHHHTGPVTMIRLASADEQGATTWHPFADRDTEAPAVERNLFKTVLGNRLEFEEIHHELQLVCRYRWAGCDEFGWVRTVSLENRGTAPRRLEILDGLRNILPADAPLAMYQQTSNLVDAYKTSEIDTDTGLGIFSLTSGITDRAEALESLTANVAWCCGLEGARHHLSERSLHDFRHGRVLSGETRLDGRRGNFLVSTTLDLDPGQTVTWHLALDSRRDHGQIATLRRQLAHRAELPALIDAALQRSDHALRAIVASADGLQLTGRPESWAHHLANVLFNNMRGGVFAHNHDVASADFARFLETRNRDVAHRHGDLVSAWPAIMTVNELLDATRETGDADLERLGHEYLPLYFGRRHGDPSRPWNRFSIEVRDSNGGRALNHEGNWRDIFQNWEGLATAFPGFLPSMVSRFVNASTVDGFNPYRITRDGVDWEVVVPEDPWSNIGYWGDHQIIYLLKLLEALDSHDPRALDDMLGREIFSYADVPYRLRPYADLVRDSAETIDFDHERDLRAERRTADLGTDGKLLASADGQVRHANLLEKLLVPALSKLSNYIPGAGIWMNTQRPEWNDANNALAGGAASMVTLCYLRRFLIFFDDQLARHGTPELPVADQVATWLDAVHSVFMAHTPGDSGVRQRRAMMDALGEAFSSYRATAYDHGLGTPRPVTLAQVRDLCRVAGTHLDSTIEANRRPDGLFHTYNLPVLTEAAVDIERLAVMLEGQVAVLSSGALSAGESLLVMERLFASELYRTDQHSFVLYPAVERPGFLDRNQLPDALVADIPLLHSLRDAGDKTLVIEDTDGVHHFHRDLRNARDLEAALDTVARDPEFADAVARDRTAVLDLFESVFQHHSYTGRSGTMYGYEGLGCIYWHMVAKLLLAVQETVQRAESDGVDRELRDALAGMYYRVRAGLGYEKSVAEYGAFPTDPYSHTPPDGGARQPGMTGQVKEEILTRLGELGVRVDGGVVRFAPTLLQSEEFVTTDCVFDFLDVAGEPDHLALPAGSLAFTYCQVPVRYVQTNDTPWIEIRLADGTVDRRPGCELSQAESAALLARDGMVRGITVGVHI